MDKRFDELKKIVYELTSSKEEFLSFCKENEENLLTLDPILYLGLKVDFYLQRDLINEALEVIENHKKGKYISLECEEFLSELKDKIIKEIKQNNKKELTPSALKKELLSHKKEQVYYALRVLSTRNIRQYLDVIQEYFKQNKDHEDLTRLMLFLLVEQSINGFFTLYLNKEKKILNPSRLVLPLEYDDYHIVENELKNHFLNPSDFQLAHDFLSQMAVSIYPDSLLKDYKSEDYIFFLQMFLNSLYGKEMLFSSNEEENLYFEMKEKFF